MGDIRNGTSGTAAVAGDEEETVLPLPEVGIRGLAGSTGDIFHYCLLAGLMGCERRTYRYNV